MSLRSMNPALASTILEHFVKYSGRRAIADPTACQTVLDKLDLKAKYPNSNKLTIIDVFSGEGVFSSMLNYELKPQKHIIIEKNPTAANIWRNRIQLLENETKHKENFELLPRDGYDWITYKKLFEDGHVSDEFKPRDRVHDELLLVANLTTPKAGESLFAQWMMCCGYKNWIHKYGNVRMICFVPLVTAQKFLAGPGCKKRNKSSLKREFITDTRLVAITQSPAEKHDGDGYDPNVLYHDQPVIIPSSATHPVKGEFAIVEILPSDISAEVLDSADHLIQTLFIAKSRPLHQALEFIAPGAAEYLAPLLPTEMLDKGAMDLTIDEWTVIFNAYENWPFKPSLLDYIVSAEDL